MTVASVTYYKLWLWHYNYNFSYFLFILLHFIYLEDAYLVTSHLVHVVILFLTICFEL